MFKAAEPCLDENQSDGSVTSEHLDICHNQKKIKVKDIEINYLKIGDGPQTLFCLNGGLGTIDNFKPLIENLDHGKYTIVVWDAPGVGKSRPPDRDYSPGYLYREADYAIALMETLKIDKYSLLGSCGGGVTALIVASKDAGRVDKLVVWSCNAYITKKDFEFLETLGDIRNWSEGYRRHAIHTYGEQYAVEKAFLWIDSFRRILNECDGDICRQVLPEIKAPTLILHGARDVVIPVHHSKYLHEHIKDSTLEILPDGTHFIFCDHFYSTVDTFLTPKQ